ncbi:hypothetical protein [Flavihumibacter sp. ZG627]|uniref:hypothetical protein n=1 Tax=Flavihumibacter sp. ZG627 TaxID=1463156 RepID=UPI00057E03BE|nr:hypothetical protein [Flavihumibacter sp. ZG627]KIC89036.1 hypothetical protein HY58_19115 [Flavihumibacter sp. ZG627]
MDSNLRPFSAIPPFSLATTFKPSQRTAYNPQNNPFFFSIEKKKSYSCCRLHKDVTALQRSLISTYAVALYAGCYRSLSVAFEEQAKAVPIAWIYSTADRLRQHFFLHESL